MILYNRQIYLKQTKAIQINTKGEITSRFLPLYSVPSLDVINAEHPNDDNGEERETKR